MAGVVVEIADESKIDALEEKWNLLAKEMKRSSIFCSWEWIKVWIKYFKNNYKLFIFLLYEGEELIGILPLSEAKKVTEDNILKSRALMFCGSNELGSDHMDIICHEDNVNRCLDAVHEYLFTEYRKWDVIHFSHLPQDSTILAWLKKDKQNLRYDVKKVSEALYINTSGDFECFNKSIKGSKRRDLNRLRRVLYDKMGVKYVKYDPELYSDAIDILFDLHNKRAVKKGIRTSFKGDILRSFHKEVAGLLFNKGCLRFRFLMDGKTIIAANYCFEFNNRLFGYQQGIEPEWEKKSVGNILIYELIQEAFNDEIIEFDLLRGGGKHKTIWTKEVRNLSNVNIYNSSLTSFMLYFTYTLRNKLVIFIKKLI